MNRIRTLDISELNDRLLELEAKRDAAKAAQEELDDLPEDASDDERTETCEAADAANSEFTDDDKKELAELEDLRNEIGESRGKISEDGGPFVDARDFEDYARELAEDLEGKAIRDAHWPFSCIDWEEAASQLQQDYSIVTYQGTDYLYRP